MPAPLGVIAGLWRYPIKGVQGERLERAEVDENGILGDRSYVIRETSSGRFLGAKAETYSWGDVLGAEELIQLRAEYMGDPDRGGEVSDVNVTAGDGVSFTSRDYGMDAFLSEILHREVRLTPFDQVAGERRRSGRALHLLTDASVRKIREFYPEGEFDVRRFRPNLVVETTGDRDGFLEEGWSEWTLAVGSQVRIRVEKPNKRCIVTTMRQGDLPSDDRILKTIATKNRSNLGVMCSVVRGGTVQAGDEVHTAV
jgi:MOSC domain-containing protein